MHILFISQYFHPEIGAASERITSFARTLCRCGHEVTVVTGFPNYPLSRRYPGYRKRLYSIERYEGIRVIRVWLFTSAGSGIIPRVLNYLSFMVSSIMAGVWVKSVDRVIATSGPLFAGFAGYAVSTLKKAPFLLDVRDIWPERIYAGTNMKRGWAIRQLEKLELFLYRKSRVIVAVTEGVRENIVLKNPDRAKVHVITNGVNREIFAVKKKNRSLAEKLGIGGDKFVAIYAGTLGLLQDIELLVKCADRLRMHKDILFLVVGSGARYQEFLDMIYELRLDNVIAVPPVPLGELNDYINLADVGLNANTDHLHNNMAIPVKIFTYMACAKPVVLANAGEVVDLVTRNNAGICVPPGDAEAFSKALIDFYHDREMRRLYGENGAKLARDEFSAEKLALKLEAVLTSSDYF